MRDPKHPRQFTEDFRRQAVAPPDAADVLGRGFDGHRPRTHVAAGLACARRVALVLRLPARRPVQPGDRGLLPRPAQGRVEREGRLLERRVPDHRVRDVPLGPRGGVPQRRDRRAPDRLRDRGSASGPGDPHDNAVAGSANHILKRELVAGGRFGSEEELRAALFDWANRHDDLRIHSTLGYMSPVEFREAGLILS